MIPLYEGLLWHTDCKIKLRQHYLTQPRERGGKMKCSWLAFVISVWSMHFWRTNHRNLGWNRLPGRLNPTSNLKQSCCWQQIMSTIHWLDFEKLRDWRFKSLSQQAIPGLHHPPGENRFPTNLPQPPKLHFVGIAECFTTGHYYWAEFGSISFKILQVVCK